MRKTENQESPTKRTEFQESNFKTLNLYQKNSPLPRSENLWDARLGWFWYNDAEIFTDSDKELEAKAAAMAERGINYAITFSCTHFRWSFYKYWPLLNETLSRVVEALHKYDIRVIEHHSAVLTHDFEQDDSVLKKRKSTLSSWPEWTGGLHPKHNPVIIDGFKLSDFFQIDVETGKAIGTDYKGYTICVNNPHYLRAYLGYLESIYRTGVDGIMTDDVGYFSSGCGCVFCRRKFKEQTGCEMPIAGDGWKTRAAADNSSYSTFLDFKRKSVEDFHLAVKKHYENLGLKLLRPNYHAHCFHNYKFAYCLQKLPALDWVFQEAGGAHIMEYSWPSWGPETAHRFSVARFRNIPSMLMTYPTRESNLILSWALAMSWGQLYSGATDIFEMPDCEKPLREFECSHKKLLLNSEKFSHLGFYDSHRSRELSSEYAEEVHPQLMCWLTACSMSNFPYDVFSTEEIEKRLPRYNVIVLIGVKYLSKWELNEIGKFLAGGGTVVLTGESGCCDCSGSPREASEIADLFGCPEFRFPGKKEEIKAFSAGAGTLQTCGSHFLVGGYEQEYRLSWWSNDTLEELTIPFKRMTDNDIAIRCRILTLLAELFPDGTDLQCLNFPDGVLVTAFLNHKKDSIIIHLVNTAGILNKQDGALLSYFDEDSVPFPSHKGKETITLTVRKPECLNMNWNKKAVCHSLANPHEYLKVENCSSSLTVQLPAEIIKDYLLIELKTTNN